MCNCDLCTRLRKEKRMDEKAQLRKEIETIIDENIEDKSVKKDVYKKMGTGWW